MTAAVVALVCCGLVAAGMALGWALHADNLRRHSGPVILNRGHARRLP